MEKALLGWPIVLQYDFKAKYRLISRKFAGMKFFHPRVRLTNQKRKTTYDQFLVILDNTRVRKSKPNFFRSESVSILSIESQTYTYKLQLGNALKSSVYTVYTKGEYMRQESCMPLQLCSYGKPFHKVIGSKLATSLYAHSQTGYFTPFCVRWNGFS